MNRVCITTVVDAEYMEYIPLFTYCLKQVYPSYKVILILRDPCPYPTFGAETIRLFEDFPRYPYMSIACRFVVPPEVYKDFDYVYITDIDMMIMPERIAIDEFHLAEMVSTGLCYSNSLRNVNHYAGFSSLTGLHFASNAWYRYTEIYRKFYYEKLKQGLLGLYREYDGVMLYRLAQKTGLGLPQKYKLKKRHHGIHLGNFRLFNSKQQYADRISEDFRSQWQAYQSDPEFSSVISIVRTKNSMLNEQLIALDDFIRNPKE